MVTHRGNLNYQDCRRVLVDGYVEDGPNFLDDKVGRCLTVGSVCFKCVCHLFHWCVLEALSWRCPAAWKWSFHWMIGLVEVCMLFACLMCFSGAVAAMSRSMDWRMLGLSL